MIYQIYLFKIINIDFYLLSALCRNMADSSWYNFDDSRVESVLNDKVVSQDAYLLFYQVVTHKPHTF